MIELRNEVERVETTLAKERAEKAKILAEAAHERRDIQAQHYAETERATMTLQRVQTTYQNQLLHYKDQEVVTANLIKQLKDERQAAEDKSKMRLKWIGTLYMHGGIKRSGLLKTTQYNGGRNGRSM